MARFIIAFAIVALVTIGLAQAAPAEEKYTDKYDNIDFKEIAKSERLLENYMNCIIDGVKCTNEGKELKEHIPEALENECAKCTDKQKEGTRWILEFLAKEKPDLWERLCAKYDPERKYRTKYEDRAKAAGIPV